MERKSLLETDGVANLPIILCGPILRKVDSSTVSVFLALKYNIPVKLTVYDNCTSNYKNTGLMATSLGPSNSNYISPSKVGKNLYVICLTAKTANIGSQNLITGKTYFYDIIFSDNGTIKNIAIDHFTQFITQYNPNLYDKNKSIDDSSQGYISSLNLSTEMFSTVWFLKARLPEMYKLYFGKNFPKVYQKQINDWSGLVNYSFLREIENNLNK